MNFGEFGRSFKEETINGIVIIRNIDFVHNRYSVTLMNQDQDLNLNLIVAALWNQVVRKDDDSI